jgi:hypothetical protein
MGEPRTRPAAKDRCVVGEAHRLPVCVLCRARSPAGVRKRNVPAILPGTLQRWHPAPRQRRSGLCRRDDDGQLGFLPRVARRQLGRPLQPPGGLHAGAPPRLVVSPSRTTGCPSTTSRSQPCPLTGSTRTTRGSRTWSPTARTTSRSTFRSSESECAFSADCACPPRLAELTRCATVG